MTDALLAAVIGVGAGSLSGLFGVGGGVLFVPALTLLIGLSQLHAQATSLAAMIPVVSIGAWRQSSHGNVRWRPALIIGFASIGGVVGGSAIANSLPQDLLRKLFGAFLLIVAGQLIWASRRDLADHR